MDGSVPAAQEPEFYAGLQGRVDLGSHAIGGRGLGRAFFEGLRYAQSMKARILRFSLMLNSSLLALGVVLSAIVVRADQVEMRNGDRYLGRIVSVNTNQVVLNSDLLGQLRLARSQIASIQFGVSNKAALTNAPASPTNDSAKVLSELKEGSGAAKKVEQDLLSEATPEVKAKYNEMVSALLNGKMTVADVRREAETAARQLRDLRRELGEESGGALDGYLAILEKFLNETPKAEPASPPAAVKKPLVATPLAKEPAKTPTTGR
jgi:hypothetical protein